MHRRGQGDDQKSMKWNNSSMVHEREIMSTEVESLLHLGYRNVRRNVLNFSLGIRLRYVSFELEYRKWCGSLSHMTCSKKIKYLTLSDPRGSRSIN